MRQSFLAFFLLTLLTACGGGDEAERFEVAVNGVHGGAISDDGFYAVLGSVHHGGSLWRLEDGERLFNWNHSEGEQSIFITADIDPSSRWALTAEAHTMVLWDVDSGQAARLWTAPGEVLDAELARGGSYALLGLADHSAVIFNSMRGGVARTFTHQGRVRSVGLSFDGRLAITGSEDQTAVIWQVKSGQALMTIQHQEDVQLVAISPNGRYAFTAAKYDRAEIWDVQSKQSLARIPLSKERLKRGLRVTAARFSQDGQRLLLGYSNRKVELWDMNKMAVVKSWKLSLRNPWQPTGASALDVSFAEQANQFYVLATNGFIYILQR